MGLYDCRYASLKLLSTWISALLWYCGVRYVSLFARGWWILSIHKDGKFLDTLIVLGHWRYKLIVGHFYAVFLSYSHSREPINFCWKCSCKKLHKDGKFLDTLIVLGHWRYKLIVGHFYAVFLSYSYSREPNNFCWKCFCKKLHNCIKDRGCSLYLITLW